jgi:stage V sporulation protein SpoVS
VITVGAAFYHPPMHFSACRFSVAAWLLAAAWLTGCSTLDVPRADNYPATGQKKVRAIHHWDVLAEDVAARVAGKIATWPPGEHPIHVAAIGASDFNQGFVKLLRVHLLDHGVTLSTVPSAVELQVQTQVVQHEADTLVNPLTPLPMTMLGGGIGVLRDWQTHYSDRTLLPGAATGIGLGVGLAIDLARRHSQGDAAGGPTRTEVLVTTTLTNEDLYLTGTADMYYIERADAALYVPPPPPPPAPVVKTWKVVTP